MSRHIVVLAGDGIGPEVTAAAVEVLPSRSRRGCMQAMKTTVSASTPGAR